MKIKKMNLLLAMLFFALNIQTLGAASTTKEEAKGIDKESKQIAPDKPNILFVVLDDTGYADIGAYGSEVKTTNMDAIAANGVKYNNFHATPSCSPTRAALLTGKESHRVGMGLITEYDLGPTMPAYRARITPKAATIAQVLQKDGYGTYAIGKWHLVPPTHQNASGPFMHWPLGKGFDRFYGFHAGSMDQFTPALVSDNSFIDVKYKKDEVLTTDLVDNAITYLRDHVSFAPERPFFMYLSMPGMHAPHQASERYLKKYRGKFDAGWDEIRQKRFERQKNMGLIPKDALLSASNPGIEQWKDLDDKSKKVYARFQEVYAAMLEETDDELGRFLEELKRLGKLENTMIVLISDNGGSSSGNFDGSVNSSCWNNKVRETIDDNFKVIDTIGRPGSGSNYPRGWAQASNAPFPYYKTNTHGGGVNVPLIISWPDGIKARGEIRDQYHHVSDVMPTILDILDMKSPEKFDGVPQLSVDGISMKYTLEDVAAKSQRTSQFYRLNDNRGIYLDGWHAVTNHKRGTLPEDDQWSLYNLNSDFTQSTDVSAKHPDMLSKMKNFWQKEAERVGASVMFETITKKQMRTLKPVLKTNFVLYPNTSHLLEKSTPKVMNHSFDITVPVSEVTKDTEGVLVAHGNGHSGYVLYVKDNKLVLEYNFLSKVQSVGKLYKLVSTKDIPLGKSTLGFKYTKTVKEKVKGKKKEKNTGEGIGELSINGEVVAKIDMPRTMTARMSHEGLDVGQDRYSAVGDGYSAPFAFSAQIEKVEINVKDD